MLALLHVIRQMCGALGSFEYKGNLEMNSNANSAQVPETEWDYHDASLSHGDILDTYTRIREQCPVVHSDAYGGYFHLSRYEGVRVAATQPRYFSSADGINIPTPAGVPRIPP